MNKLIKISVLAIVLFFASCVGSSAQFAAYVRAHKLSHEAQAPHYMQYVNADPTLDQEAKNIFARRVQAEADMISQAEQSLGIGK